MSFLKGLLFAQTINNHPKKPYEVKVSQGCIFTIPFSKATFIFLKKKVVPYKFPHTSGKNNKIVNNPTRIARAVFLHDLFNNFLKKIINKAQTKMFHFKLFRHDVIFHKLILL